MGKNKSKPQADQRADMRGSRFIGLPKVVHESAAYRAASPAAKVVLWEILARFNGYNNDDINLDVRTASDALGRKNQTAAVAAFGELMQLGLIDLATGAIWQQRKARRWRVTFISTGSAPHIYAATNEYLRWSEADRGLASKAKRDAPRKYCATRGVAEQGETATPGVADTLGRCDAGRSSGDGNEPNFQGNAATRGVAVISIPYGGGSKEPLKAPETAGGVSNVGVAPDLLGQLRERLALHLEGSEPGTQTRIAAAANIPGGTLSKFLAGKGLNRTHFVNLQLALPSERSRRAA